MRLLLGIWVVTIALGAGMLIVPPYTWPARVEKAHVQERIREVADQIRCQPVGEKSVSASRVYICENCGGSTEPMTHPEYLRRAECGRLVYCLICAAFAIPKRISGLSIRRAA